MLPSADAAAVPVTPRELSVGPQRRRNVTVLPMNKLLAVPRVCIPPRKGAGRHVDPSLARELERLDYSAWLAVGEALASLTDVGVERGGRGQLEEYRALAVPTARAIARPLGAVDHLGHPTAGAHVDGGGDGYRASVVEEKEVDLFQVL